MQQESSPSFLPLLHGGSAVCAFHPKEQYLFASGDGKSRVLIGNVLLKRTVKEITLPSSSTPRYINGIQFMPDGNKIVVPCQSRRLSVIDLERGDVIINYENCTYPAGGRQPIISHPDVPHLTACLTVNGKGITLIDLRLPLPLDLVLDLYDSPISDLCFVDGSWPWGNGDVSLISGGNGPIHKVTNLSGRLIDTLPSKGSLTALATSPGIFRSTKHSSFPSVILSAGGEKLHSMVPISLEEEEELEKCETFESFGGKVLKTKYSCSGGLLYASTKDGHVIRYRRYPDRHEPLRILYSHKAAVTDFDISAYGDYLISSSVDGTIGMITLGAPTHGWTQYYELT